MIIRFIACSLFLGLLAACQSATTAAPTVHAVAATDEEMSLLRKGDTARALGDIPAAELHYQQAASLSQGAVRAHLELADIYALQGEAAKRKAVLKDAYALNMTNPEVSKEYAQVLLAAGEAAEAEAVARNGLQYSAQDVRLLNVLGVALDQQGKHTEAQTYYAQAMEFSSAAVDKEITLNNHALSLIVDGKAAQAIAQLETELPHVQNKAALRQMLALAHGVEGNTDKAYELGLRDLSVREVKENLDYYARIRSGEIPRQSLLAPQS
jgi:Flp pilus assembly protein TadD